ncbi:hypothetical protein [Thermosulfuriphilus sp.]
MPPRDRPWLALPLVVLFLLLVISSPGQAHRVGSRIIKGGLGIEAYYDDGSPMAYCPVKVYREGGKLPFQAGATDAQGRFLFYPDPPGTYLIIVSDGLGHKLELKINTQDLQPLIKAPPLAREDGPSGQITVRALGGLGLIFLFYWALRRLSS